MECIYMNYDKPARLHEYTYLGLDCWDRQRIKRKIERFVNKLRGLPDHEREAILEAVGIHYRHK